MGDISFLKFLKRSKFDFNLAKKYYDSYDKIMELGLFDKEFYLSNYPHIAESDIDPLEHFLFFGYDEKKYPSPHFDLYSYEQKHPDININPLVHYILEGEQGHIFLKSPAEIAKERLINVNSLFLNNCTFEDEPLVSIIVLNRNGSKHLKRLFTDFASKTNYNNYEIIVVDNASTDDSLNVLEEFSKDLPIEIIKNDINVSFSQGNNDAAKIANGEYLLLLNNDIEPTFGWLNELMGVMLNNENVGAVGAKLVFPYTFNMENQETSFSIQHAGVKFREEMTPYIYGPYHENMFLTMIFSHKVNELKESISNTAATLLVPKKLYLDLGGLDEGYFYGYEDIDFAFKLYTNNYKTFYCPSALLFHHESATRINDERVHEINFKNISLFKDKWGDILFKDILNDKINHKNFLTEEKLNFSIISENNINNLLTSLIKDLNSNNYDFNLICDMDDYFLGNEVDILLSFTLNYNTKKSVSRLNLIKILILDSYEDNFDNINDYDIILTCNEEVFEKIKNNNLENVFKIDKDEFIKNSTEKLIEIIKKVYLG
ncbi:glycosyltransferase family 2 protein [Methanobrevibacter sp. DSM 116169]|uniref:glycosyltransferase family 2 protein n=1 Tax=Methanobrevibacter sp. DSM 116169 TaxID=3242727 RepID=UPI0038FC322D